MASETSPLLLPNGSGEDSVSRSERSTTTATATTNTTSNKTVAALAVTVFVQSYLLEGVFPYAGFLALEVLRSKNDNNDLDIDIDEETVGRYAGYIGGSFMFGRALTAVLWGRMADSRGRIPVLRASLVMSGLASLGFGFAATYTQALAWRLGMGLGNGITGTITCLLGEIHLHHGGSGGAATSNSASSAADDDDGGTKRKRVSAKGKKWKDRVSTLKKKRKMKQQQQGDASSPDPSPITTKGTITAIGHTKDDDKNQNKKETRTMAIVYGIRGCGVLLSPVITGYLSDPMAQYPDLMEEVLGKLPPAAASTTSSLLLAYPFVVPNILAAVLCGIAYVLVGRYIPETLPADQRQSALAVPEWLRALLGGSTYWCWCRGCFQSCQPRMARRSIEDGEIPSSPTAGHRQQLLLVESPLPRQQPHEDETKEDSEAWAVATAPATAILPPLAPLLSSSSAPKPSTTTSTVWDLFWAGGDRNNNDNTEGIYGAEAHRNIVRVRWHHLGIYWMFGFLNLATDELFPLFCLSIRSGLGLVEHQISQILAGTTVIFLCLQYVLLTGLVDRWGLYRTLKVGMWGSVPWTFLIPVGSLLIVAHTPSSISTTATPPSLLLYIYLAAVIAVTKAFASVFFSTITMATNRTVQKANERATLNGVAALGGSLSKACGPVVAGNLMASLAGDFSPIAAPYGPVVAYSILSVLGIVLGGLALGLKSVRE